MWGTGEWSGTLEVLSGDLRDLNERSSEDGEATSEDAAESTEVRVGEAM